MSFFLDDYFFLKISDANSFGDFLNFFSPFRTYSFKPLAAEVYYFLIHLFNESAFIGHIIAFAVYFVGLYYLYKVLASLTKNVVFSKLAVILYSVHFTHVFHFYYLGTVQETFLFTCLVISFFYFLSRKVPLGLLFYVLALLTKETAILYFPFLIIFQFIHQKKELKKASGTFFLYLLISVAFYFLYSVGLRSVTSLDQYRLHFDPKFIANNFLWYLIWGLGGPNFLPDYFRSIFAPPITAFWKVLKNKDVLTYFFLLGVYWLGFLLTSIFYLTKRAYEFKPIVKNLFLTLGAFFIFLGPILLFEHQWMLRLMLPVIFLSVFQAYILFKFISIKGIITAAGYILIALYLVTNILGTSVHEETSTYLLENKIFSNAREYFSARRNEIEQHDIIYFQDSASDLPKGWGGSEKLKNSLNGNNFLYYHFPKREMKAVYGYEETKIPSGAYVIDSDVFFK